jgi:hypothetical protein
MRLSHALVVLALLAMGPAAAAEAVPGPAAAPAAAAVVRSMGLDRLFVQFGRNMALSPQRHGITDGGFLEAWKSVTSDTFARDELNARLLSVLSRGLGQEELDGISAFLDSPFGSRVNRLEQEAQTLPADQHIAAIARGQALYLQSSRMRQAQLDALLELSGAEVTFAMLGESLRGMAIGLHLAAHGDLDIPWEEIDSSVGARLAGMRQSLAEASRGALALTYAELTDAELATYLEFLRRPATRKFYSVASVTVGAIIREAMLSLGADVAARLQRVDI